MNVTVVGIGADGWEGLPAEHRSAITESDVLLGGSRHLAMVPGSVDAIRQAWPSPLRSELPGLLETYAGRRVVALASGDPLVSGIGSTLIELLGPGRVEIRPALSSITLARARMAWPAETTDAVSLVGRESSAVLRLLSPGRRLVVLSADGGTPRTVAGLLDRAGYGPSPLTVLSDLGSADEARIESSAGQWGDRTAPPLNVVCVECVPADRGAAPWPTAGALPDDAYEHDGQLTKQDLRASALARLAPVPDQLLWDVGAGAGSVAVEWMRADPRCRALAVESDPVRAERIRGNADRLGVPGLQVLEGAAPDALTGLPEPDAVFVGGGASVPGVVEHCREALRPGGRLVVHAVTLESESVVVDAWRSHGGDLTRLSVDRAAPIGTFTGWTPARPVVQWHLTKGAVR